MNKKHRIKTHSKYWTSIRNGQKRFEVRKNDRDYQTGDLLELVLTEDLPLGMPKSEEELVIVAEVGYILHGGQFGIEPGYCVIQLENIREL